MGKYENGGQLNLSGRTAPILAVALVIISLATPGVRTVLIEGAAGTGGVGAEDS